MFDVLQMLGGETVPTKAFKLSNYSSMDCEGNTKYEGIISVYMNYLLFHFLLVRLMDIYIFYLVLVTFKMLY